MSAVAGCKRRDGGAAECQGGLWVVASAWNMGHRGWGTRGVCNRRMIEGMGFGEVPEVV